MYLDFVKFTVHVFWTLSYSNCTQFVLHIGVLYAYRELGSLENFGAVLTFCTIKRSIAAMNGAPMH